MKKSILFFLNKNDLLFLIFSFFGVFLFGLTKLISTVLSLDTYWYLKLCFYLILFTGFLFTKRKDIDSTLLYGLYFFYSFIVFYLYFSPLYISDTELENFLISNNVFFIIKWHFYISIFFLILSFFRPLLGFFILIIFFYKKKFINEFYGFNISSTDWLNVYEFFVLFILLIFSQQIFLKLKSYGKINYLNFQNIDIKNFQFYFFLICVAIHFASYFYSGLAKAGIINHLSNIEFSTWFLNNDTNNIILASWYAKTFPLAAYEKLASQSYQVAQIINTPLNIIVIFSQLFCIICFFRISLIKYFCVLFDIIHISIFFLTGIFFWKWITLNLIIFFVVRKYEKVNINYLKKFTFIFFILFSFNLFFVAKLAWFDSKSMNASFFEAVDKKGKIYKVPSNYFGNLSLPIAQMRLGREFEGYFKTGVYASIYDYKNYDKSNQCSLEVDNYKEALTNEKFQKIKKIVQSHHEYILGNLNNFGRIKYDNYGHHIWSNPFLYKDFNRLDKRNIVSYNYVIQAVCLDFINNNFKPTIIKKHNYEIDLK